jgi:hypothetical protein
MNDFIEKNKDKYEFLSTELGSIKTETEFMHKVNSLDNQYLYLLAKLVDEFVLNDSAENYGLNSIILEDTILTGHSIARIVKNVVFRRFLDTEMFG